MNAFLASKEYSKESITHQSILHTLQSMAQGKGWPVNAKARLALLYLIGKAKSRVHIEIFWPPITTASAPVIARSGLKVVARAYTYFVRTLVEELPAAFLVLNLADMGAWVKQLNSWSPDYIGEADCKDQFNHIPPSLVIQHMKEAAAGLKARRRWRAATLGRSIHKENRQLGRTGPAKKGAFHFMPMDELVSLVEFSLTHDNVNHGAVQALSPWAGHLVPTPQTSIVYRMCKRLVSRMRNLGEMSVTDASILQRRLPSNDIVALR